MNILESSTHGVFQVVINEIEHQKALMMELRDIILPIPDPYSGQAKLVQQLFEDILTSSSKCISFLELGDKSGKLSNLIKSKRKGGKHNTEKHILEEESKDTGDKRRKNAQHIGSVVTQAPHYDGYQWRKYGQKWISKAKHSRSYYRCANSKGQGCLATKTVQQKENDGSGVVRLFNVEYYGQHICKRDDIFHPDIVKTTHHSVPLADHNQSSSSISINDVHGIQDGSFEKLFMVPDTPEYLTDIEMARVLEVTSMDLPQISEDWDLVSQ
ncbi:probable WRKY transcription factor 46 [Phragmites australis]|uniref:probable WRKY transcription factor 46 n=1 Tax=Phragmites australis TaxID=29695 RepID=UPI002D7673BE|nr:probable WRKY transcription factor 46 [Phragmites australis]